MSLIRLSLLVPPHNTLSSAHRAPVAQSSALGAKSSARGHLRAEWPQPLDCPSSCSGQLAIQPSSRPEVELAERPAAISESGGNHSTLNGSMLIAPLNSRFLSIGQLGGAISGRSRRPVLADVGALFCRAAQPATTCLARWRLFRLDSVRASEPTCALAVRRATPRSTKVALDWPAKTQLAIGDKTNKSNGTTKVCH